MPLKHYKFSDMELLSLFFAFVGGFIVWYMNKSAKTSLKNAAQKAVIYFEKVEMIDYEVETLQRKWIAEGFVSDKDQEYISALYGRRFDLERNLNRQ